MPWDTFAGFLRSVSKTEVYDRKLMAADFRDLRGFRTPRHVHFPANFPVRIAPFAPDDLTIPRSLEKRCVSHCSGVIGA